MCPGKGGKRKRGVATSTIPSLPLASFTLPNATPTQSNAVQIKPNILKILAALRETIGGIVLAYAWQRARYGTQLLISIVSPLCVSE
jgi:hypothetical protein